MAVSAKATVRHLVVDDTTYVAVDDLLLALSTAEVAWEAGGHDVTSLRLFGERRAETARRFRP